jgi:uncharacterized membrane protein
MDNGYNRRPLLAAGTLLGIGMGGFVDGIVFHQLLQFHNMLSAKLPPTSIVNIEINMFWDGVFHAFTWAMTALGLALLWRAVRCREVPLSTGTFVGSLSLGWGIFNLGEGIINHHVLHLHHVTEGENHLVWDVTFLASGLVLLLVGMVVIRGSRAAPAGREA